MSLLTGLTSDAGSYTQQQQQPRTRDYKFSFSQSYAYPHQLQTNNLNQVYFVNDYALYDFRQASERKLRTDDRVEDEVIRRLEKKCSESQKQRQSYLNQARRYQQHPEAYEMYQQKAEEVDQSYCHKLQEDQRVLEVAER